MSEAQTKTGALLGKPNGAGSAPATPGVDEAPAPAATTPPAALPGQEAAFAILMQTLDQANDHRRLLMQEAASLRQTNEVQRQQIEALTKDLEAARGD